MANIAEAIFRNISKPLSIFACSYVEASSRQTKRKATQAPDAPRADTIPSLSLCLSVCLYGSRTEAPNKQQQQQKSTKYDTMLQCGCRGGGEAETEQRQ